MKNSALTFAFLFAIQLRPGGVFGAQPDVDQRAFQGRWICTLCQRSGVIDGSYQKPVLVSGSEFTFQTDSGRDTASIALDPIQRPKRLTWKHEVEVFDHPLMCEFRGIYLIDGDTILICASNGTKDPMPESFESTKGNGRVLMILKRDTGTKREAKDDGGKGLKAPKGPGIRKRDISDNSTSKA